jgi:hypothetical protein
MQDDRSDDIERLKDRIEKLEDALRRIKEWCNAYPTDIFLPVSEAELHRAVTLMKANGIRTDALYGEWARHIMHGIKLITMVSED